MFRAIVYLRASTEHVQQLVLTDAPAEEGQRLARARLDDEVELPSNYSDHGAAEDSARQALIAIQKMRTELDRLEQRLESSASPKEHTQDNSADANT